MPDHTSCQQPEAERTSCPDRTMSEQEQVNQEWNEVAGEWDDMAAGYATAFYGKLWEVTGLSDPSNLKVMDFGCGTGLLTSKLQKDCASVIAIDAAPKMVEVLKEKIRSREWSNVQGTEAVLARDSSMLLSHDGSLDLVVASSVMTFIPHDDLDETMEVIGRLLKPGGFFVHSDWPMAEGKQEKEVMTKEKALRMYEKGGMVLGSNSIVGFCMDESHSFEVYLGVARKKV